MAIQTPRIDPLQDIDPGFERESEVNWRTIGIGVQSLGEAATDVNEQRSIKRAIDIFEKMEDEYWKNELSPAVAALGQSSELDIRRDPETGAALDPYGMPISEGALNIARNLGLLNKAAAQGFSPGGLAIRKEAYILQATRANPGLAPILNKALQIQTGLGEGSQKYVTSYWEDLLVNAQKANNEKTQLTSAQQIEDARKLGINIEAYDNQWDFARDVQNAARMRTEAAKLQAEVAADWNNFRVKVYPMLVQQTYQVFQDWIWRYGITPDRASSVSEQSLQLARAEWKALASSLLANWNATYTKGTMSIADFEKEVPFLAEINKEVDKVSLDNLSGMFNLVKNRAEREGMISLYGSDYNKYLFEFGLKAATATGFAEHRNFVNLISSNILKRNGMAMNELGADLTKILDEMNAKGEESTTGNLLGKLRDSVSASEIWGGKSSPEKQKLQVAVLDTLLSSGNNPKLLNDPQYAYQLDLYLKGLEEWYKTPGTGPSKTVAKKALDVANSIGFRKAISELPNDKRDVILQGLYRAVATELSDLNQRLISDEAGLGPEVLAEVVNRPIPNETIVETLNRWAYNLASVLDFKEPSQEKMAYPPKELDTFIRYNQGRYEFASRSYIDKDRRSQSATTAKLNAKYGEDLNRILAALEVFAPSIGNPNKDLYNNTRIAIEEGERAILGRN
jgi:hypothetical protein